MEEIKALLDSLVSTCLRASNSEDKPDEDKEDEKAENKKACNDEVDKRDIIRQIMAIAGKEEASEDVKTIAKLAEKLAYDKSEAGTADNCGKKAKNEDDEEEEKDDKKAENKKAKNEEIEDEEEKEVIEEKEAENKKAKNSIDQSVNDILNAVSGINQPKYTTQIDRLELGNKY